MITIESLENLLSQKEGISLEFKRAKNALPGEAFESVCAFLNRQGGYLILGVRDDGQLIGVDEEAVDKIQRDFTTLSNNPTKLSPVYLLELQPIKIRGVLLLCVYVPQSSQVHRCNNIVYDRGHEGDFKVSDDTGISQIYTRKSGLFTESRIYPFLKPSAFKAGMLERARNLIRSNRSNHPWLMLDDEGLLRTAGLYRTDYVTGEEGYTLAAALILGRDEVIQSILPHFRIDALVRRYDHDRFDDRLDIRTNLIDAYDHLMGFAAKHLPDKFHLNENMQRVSLREKIFREVIANVLVHREYTNPMAAKFIIYADRVELDNANKPNNYGPIDPKKFSAFPKNPSIAKFFAQLGHVDELGSGVRNVTNFLKVYSPGAKADFIEEDVFRTLIPVPVTGVVEAVTQAIPTIDELIAKVTALGLNYNATERLVKIMGILQEGDSTSIVVIASYLEVTTRTVRRDFTCLREAGIVEPGEDYGTYKLVPLDKVVLA
jgi:ATP-dependent DNA helicase RecG